MNLLHRILLLLVFLFFGLNSCTEKDVKTIREQKVENAEKVITKGKPKLFVAISTMISPQETFSIYKDLIDYISVKIDSPIEFKQRKTYEEVNTLFQKKQIDFAFICTGAFLEAKKKFPVEILVVPVVNNRVLYNALIIVNKTSSFSSFSDLKGHSFAFTDPISNTGYDYVINLLKKNNTDSQRYFSKILFTHAHDYSIQAVERKIVAGATVDGLVFDFLLKNQPEKVKNIRVIQKSRDFGIPPFVVQPNLENSIKLKLRETMLNLHNDEQGKLILNKIMIDKFAVGNDSLYN